MEAAKDTKGKTKPWIREGTWNRVEERKTIKRILRGVPERIRGTRWKTAEISEAAEKGADNGSSKEMYTITKMMTDEKRRQTDGAKDKQGVLRTEKSDKMERTL